MTNFRTFILLPFMLSCNSVYADASDGEFLGFKIGDRLNISDESLIQRDWAMEGRPIRSRILVVTSSKPADVEDVVLWITPMSHTIVGIRGRISSTSADRSKKVVSRYYNALIEKYPEWDRSVLCGRDGNAMAIVLEDREWFPCSLSLERVLHPDFGLEVSYSKYRPPSPDDFDVWIELQPLNDSLEKFKALEAEEIDRFSNQYWAEKAEESDKTGL